MTRPKHSRRKSYSVGAKRFSRAAGSLVLVAGVALAGTSFVPSAFAGNTKPGDNSPGPATVPLNITPRYHAGNTVTCPSGYTQIIGPTEANGTTTYSSGSTFFDLTIADGMWVSFSTDLPGNFFVVVKGGPAWDEYDYPGPYVGTTSDGNLHSPINGGDNIAAVSHAFVCANLSAPPPPPAMALYAAYADSFRGQQPFFPSPWQGSPNVIFIGCGFGGTDNCPQSGGTDLYDGGALRIDNTSGASFTVNSASVTIGSCVFNPWGTIDQTVNPGQTLILTQTGGTPVCNPSEIVGNYNFDTSESSPTGDATPCTDDGLTASVSLTIDGVTTVHTDTSRVLNDQGTDPGAEPCDLHDEFQPWTTIS